METAAPTIRALELENQRLRAAQRESAEAILELQREACARDGVPMPSERPLVDKLRDENQRLRADVAEISRALVNAARQSAEYLEEIVKGESEDDCDWPDVDGVDWCSVLCRTYGCAKSRSYAIREALAKNGI